MSWDPDDFSGPLNFDAAAAMEMLDANVADRLIALLESDEPIDGVVRAELANALKRGKKSQCERGAFSLKLTGLNRARQASYWGQREYFATMFADGEKIQSKLDACKAKTIPQAIKQVWSGRGRNPARRFRYALDYYREVRDWIGGLDAPPFWLFRGESWRDDKSLSEHYHGMKALEKLHRKFGGY